MVAEGGAGVCVHAEPVLRAVVLQIRASTCENFRSKRSKRDFPAFIYIAVRESCGSGMILYPDPDKTF